MTEVTLGNYEAFLISQTTEAERAWKLGKKFQKIILLNFCKSSPYFIVLLATP